MLYKAPNLMRINYDSITMSIYPRQKLIYHLRIFLFHSLFIFKKKISAFFQIRAVLSSFILK